MTSVIKDGKFRFTLQFGMNTDEEQRAGNLLEQLGKKKSPVVVAALNEYMTNHPEILSGRGDIRLHIAVPDQKHLEDMVRRLVTELIGSGILPDAKDHTVPTGSVNQVSHDILDMLADLDMFG